MTPQELVAAAQAGDRDAFAQLWATYRREMEGIAYARTGDHYLAEDIASEAFLRAWKNLPTFTWRGQGFPAWVGSIVRNIVIDYYKSCHYQRSWATDTTDEETWREVDLDRRNDPINVVAHAELAAALDEAIADLTPGQRAVIVRRFGAELSPTDTAAEVGLNLHAAKTMQHRATRALRRHPAIAALEVAA
ncbi:RNA polymerase sigma factor [Micromonospora sp. URMC 103]|uniref:RNA polymerase sigma factor n=1 Tax=Micromonospora sp. URMC 103 TaxID=3423406 RepID=UPI003F1A6980